MNRDRNNHPRTSALHRRALVLLLTVGGIGYPIGYLLRSALIPAWGLERSKDVAEALLWLPFGGLTIAALAALTATLAVRMVRR